jgi:hypothetical protein
MTRERHVFTRYRRDDSDPGGERPLFDTQVAPNRAKVAGGCKSRSWGVPQYFQKQFLKKPQSDRRWLRLNFQNPSGRRMAG